MALPPGEEAYTRMKGATRLGRTSQEQGMPSRALWTNGSAWHASRMLHWKQKQGICSTCKGKDRIMSSSTAISTDVHQKTTQQPASATAPLVERHLGLVVHLAKRYARSYQCHHILDLDDLVQEGVLGLIHAAEKFDARKGFRFSTYSTWCIRCAIGQVIMTVSRTIRVPPTLWPALHHLARAQAPLWHRYQHEPSLDELAEVMQRAKHPVLLLLKLQPDPLIRD